MTVDKYKEAQEQQQNCKRDKAGYEQVLVARLCLGSHGELRCEANQYYSKFRSL